MTRSLAALAAILAVPLLVAATRDPRGDVRPCGGGTPVAGADLVSVDALAEELGSVAVWRLRFADHVAVPGPLRIDVLVRDPQLPGRTVDGQPGVNRVVRWTATSDDEPQQILWLLEEASTPFNPPVVHGRTVEFRVPGRILLGERENGTASVARARWSVVVRDGSACDRLGAAPALRLDPVTPAASASGHPTDAVAPGRGLASAFVVLGVALLVVAGAVALVLRSSTKS